MPFIKEDRTRAHVQAIFEADPVTFELGARYALAAMLDLFDTGTPVLPGTAEMVYEQVIDSLTRGRIE